MENKRFFSFGCSFTRYAWPTWSDILGLQYSEYYNYGQYGAGNMYIFNAVMEADQFHKFNKNDLIIVQWSCSSREDRYKDGKWITPGGVANYYTQSEFKKLFDFRGFVIRDVALIKSISVFLEHIGCEYYFISMVPFFKNNMYEDDFSKETEDIEIFYDEVIQKIKPSYLEILGNYGHRRPKILNGIKIDDSHPLPTEHYRYIKEVLPHLVKTPESKAIDYDKELSEVYVDKFQGWTHKWTDSERGILNLKTRL